MSMPAEAPQYPLVSICCITYNHERFIGKTLDGFLAQQTNFPVEIIVHDDASTDRTAEILRDRVNRHPGRIRAVLRTENQHRQGRGIMPMFADWARGEFIAVCEGDDFWTDPQKLTIQVAYMQANPDCVACCHDSAIVDENGRTVEGSYFRPETNKFTQTDVIGTLLSREPTCSLLFRRSAFRPPLPEWYIRRPSDLYLDILLTEQGRLGFIDRNMAAYRIHSGGVWSGGREAARLVELVVRYRFLLSEASFRERYGDLLLAKIAEFEAQLFTRADSRTEISRLEAIVQVQAEAFDSTQKENQRLAHRERELQAELEQARNQAQLHIDQLQAQIKQTVQSYERLLAGLRNQLEQLTATSQEQSAHITVLESERDRLTSEAAAVKADAANARSAGQHHIDALKAQLDRTVAENEKVIASLHPQLAETVQRYEGYLVPLKQQLDQLAATSRQQTQHIAVLEKERDRLAAEAIAARDEAARATAAGQEHIDSLKAQLDHTVAENEKIVASLRSQLTETVQRYEGHLAPLKQQLDRLAATATQQDQYIAVLEKERDRLTAREVQLANEAAHYLKVMREQLAYINTLEATESQVPHTQA